MDHDVRSAAFNQLMKQIRMEVKENPSYGERLKSPSCHLDLETYGLLVQRTGGIGYSEFFTRAIRSMNAIVSSEDLIQVAAVAKCRRRGHQSKTVSTMIGTQDLNWLLGLAEKMRVKPPRVLEAILYIYLRTEAKEPNMRSK